MASKLLTLKRFAGIANRQLPEEIRSYPGQTSTDIDLADARNVDIDNTLRLSRRAGQTLKLGGSGIHSLWSNGSMCLFVSASGVMFQLTDQFYAIPLAAGLGAAPMAYLDLNGRVYHSNGLTSAVLDQGQVRGWGIGIDQIVVGARATGGNLAAGVYQYAMTLLREDGQESGTGLATRIDLADGAGIQFSWKVPADPAITHAALYLTQPNGETLLQALVVDVEQGGYLYTGGPRALPLATQWLDAPPPGQALAYYRGRIYIASGETLYATAPLAYEHCDLRDFLAFDGAPIELVAAVDGGLFVGTGSAVYFVSGGTLATASRTLRLQAGAVPGSLAYGDGQAVSGRQELAGQQVALFATTDGIVLGLPDGSLQQLTRERYVMPATGSAAALFEPGLFSRYLLAMQA